MSDKPAAHIKIESSIRMGLITDCRIMRGLAHACEEFATNLGGNPEVAEVMFAVAAHWWRIEERLLPLLEEQT